MPRRLPILELALDGVDRRARGLGGDLRGADAARQIGELPLAGENAMQLAVGRKEEHALRADPMALRRDERFADGERGAIGECCRKVVAAAHAVQSVGQQARDRRGGLAHLRDQRVVAPGFMCRIARSGINGDAGRRHRALAYPAERIVERGKLDRIQALAQHRLERILPARLDVDHLP